MVEVLDSAPETLTPRERYVLVVLAENARDATRICWPGIEDDPGFIRRSRLASRSQRYAVIQALVAKGVLERSRRGQKGVRAEYRVALMADVQGPGNQDPEDAPDPAFETGNEANQGPGNRDAEAFRVPETETLNGAQGPEKQDAEKQDAEVQGPGFEASGSRISTFRVPETGTPSPHTPHTPQEPSSPPLESNGNGNPPETAQTILAAFVDYCATRSVKIPKRLRGQYAKLIKDALDEGFTSRMIRSTLAGMLDSNAADRPSLLPNRLVAAQTGPERRRQYAPATSAFQNPTDPNAYEWRKPS